MTIAANPTAIAQRAQHGIMLALRGARCMTRCDGMPPTSPVQERLDSSSAGTRSPVTTRLTAGRLPAPRADFQRLEIALSDERSGPVLPLAARPRGKVA